MQSNRILSFVFLGDYFKLVSNSIRTISKLYSFKLFSQDKPIALVNAMSAVAHPVLMALVRRRRVVVL